MAKNNARMTDPNLLIQAGINPKTGLPVKFENAGDNNGFGLKASVVERMRVIDEQDAINSFTWYNLPKGLTPQLIERVLYYRGEGALFKLGDKFFFLPYTLSAPNDGSGIDCYGRYMGITPLPFNGTSTDGDPEKPWVQGLVFEPRYDWPDFEELSQKSPEELQLLLSKSCVLLHDHSPAIAQTITPASVMNQPILDLMGDCFPFMRTALLNSTGITGVKIQNENEKAEVMRASESINISALTGQKYVPIVGQMEFQELTSGSPANAEEFLLAM